MTLPCVGGTRPSPDFPFRTQVPAVRTPAGLPCLGCAEKSLRGAEEGAAITLLTAAVRPTTSRPASGAGGVEPRPQVSHRLQHSVSHCMLPVELTGPWPPAAVAVPMPPSITELGEHQPALLDFCVNPQLWCLYACH